ncbi:MAG: DUF3368 domain-containing protein [Methylococcaceae bacterium]
MPLVSCWMVALVTCNGFNFRHSITFNAEILVGSLGVLLLAKKKGLITTIKPSLTRLCCSDIFVSEHLFEQMLVMAGASEE